MAISNVLSSIITNLSSAYDALSAKGATVPLQKNMYNLASTIDSVDNISPQGIELLSRTISKFEDSTIAFVGPGAFRYCYSLTTVSFPACTNIGSYAFQYCSKLTSALFPSCVNIDSYAFGYCSSLSSISFPACINIRDFAFQYCSKLTLASFPSCMNISGRAFGYCYSLTTVSFPACTSIGTSAFQSCINLTSISFPNCENIDGYVFDGCSSLTEASFPACTNIGDLAFKNCTHLVSLYLMGSSYVTLTTSSAFYSTPIGGYSGAAGRFGSIYVPASMLASYQTMTNWAYFSSRMVGI